MKIYSYINLFPDCGFEVVWWSRRTEPDVLFHPTYVSNMYSMWTRDTEWFSHKLESLWLGYKCSLAHHHSSITFHSPAYSLVPVYGFPSKASCIVYLYSNYSLWRQGGPQQAWQGRKGPYVKRDTLNSVRQAQTSDILKTIKRSHLQNHFTLQGSKRNFLFRNFMVQLVLHVSGDICIRF